MSLGEECLVFQNIFQKAFKKSCAVTEKRVLSNTIMILGCFNVFEKDPRLCMPIDDRKRSNFAAFMLDHASQVQRRVFAAISRR